MFFTLLTPSAFSSMAHDIRYLADREKESKGHPLLAAQTLLGKLHAFWAQHFA